MRVSEGAAGESDRELLDRYRKHWGMPTDVVQVAHHDGHGFRILVFAGPDAVARLVTVGLGTCPAADGAPLLHELLLAVGARELADDIAASRVTAFVGDLATYLLARSIRPAEGSVLAPRGPAPWDPDAILFDAPRGEPSELEHIQAGGHAVRLVWAVPIYPSEAALVTQHGIAALDLLVDISPFSLVDVRRPPFR